MSRLQAMVDFILDTTSTGPTCVDCGAESSVGLYKVAGSHEWQCLPCTVREEQLESNLVHLRDRATALHADVVDLHGRSKFASFDEARA